MESHTSRSICIDHCIEHFRIIFELNSLQHFQSATAVMSDKELSHQKRSNDIFEYPLLAKSVANFQLNINLYDEIKVLKLTVSASFSVCAASSEDKMKLIATVFLLIWVQFECDLCKKGKRFQIVFNRNNRQYAISSKSFHFAAVLAFKVISASFHRKSAVVLACRKLTVLKLFHSTRRKLQFKFLNFSAFLCFIQLFNCINILQALTANVKRLTPNISERRQNACRLACFCLYTHFVTYLGVYLFFHGACFLLTVSNSNAQKRV